VAKPYSSAPALPALPAIPAHPPYFRMTSRRLAAILSDVQFWVPFAVLLIGALILAWVSR